MVLLALQLNALLEPADTSTGIVTAVVSGTMPSSTGQEVIALPSGFGKAKGIVIGAFRTATDVDDASADHASMSYGCATRHPLEGTQEWATACISEHAGTTNKKWFRTDAVILLLNTDGTIEGQASLVSFNSDSVTLNWVVAPSTAYKYWLWAITGEGLDFDVGNAVSSSVIGEETTVNTGSTGVPKGVIVAAGGTTATPDTAAAVAGCRMTIGYGSFDGSTIRQVSSSVSWLSLSGVDGAGVLHDTSVFKQAKYTTEVAEGNFSLTSFAAGRFRVTSEDVALAIPYGWAALSGNAIHCHADYETTPSATTGNKSWDFPVGAVNFTPTGIVWTPTMMFSGEFDSNTLTARGHTYSAGAADSAGLEFEGAIAHRRNTDPDNTESTFDNRFLNVRFHGGDVANEGSWVSWDSNGFTYNLTQSANNSRILPFFLVGAVVELIGAGPSPRGTFSQSGPVQGGGIQSGPVNGNAVESRVENGNAEQSGPVNGNAMRSGPVQGNGVQSA